MRIREFQESDLPKLQKLHADSGFDYPFPDMNIFERVSIVENDDGEFLWAFAARKTIEMYAFTDHSAGSPKLRQIALVQGHENMRKWIADNGFMDAVAFLPPEVEKSFGRRLTKSLGWIKGRWEHYTRDV